MIAVRSIQLIALGSSKDKIVREREVLIPRMMILASVAPTI